MPIKCMAVQRGGPFDGRYLDRHTGAYSVREVEVDAKLGIGDVTTTM